MNKLSILLVFCCFSSVANADIKITSDSVKEFKKSGCIYKNEYYDKGSIVVMGSKKIDNICISNQPTGTKQYEWTVYIPGNRY